jgi:putative hydrolase of HD superfamily
MNNLFKFFTEVGKLKKMPKKGWVLREVKNPETIASHTFRAVLMAWILGSKKNRLDMERLLKIALVHDLCEVYAGDTTPYDSILPKDKKKIKELMKTWPRFTEEERSRIAKDKHKKEKEALDMLLENLPRTIRFEIKNLWADYESGLTPEGRFFKQADRLENFLQAIEYWKINKNFPDKPWRLQIKELIDDPVLLEFVKEIDKQSHKSKK